MIGMISNPGTEDIENTEAREAHRNMGAFCRELALGAPNVRIERRGESGGRYSYMIYRGIRSVEVEMPGLPLHQVALREGDNAWLFPRLYVDGNSWLWPYALDDARRELLDHDGLLEAAYQQSAKSCDEEIAREPRCAVCGAFKDRFTISSADEPYGREQLRCVACTPVEKIEIWNWRRDAVFHDDSWKELRHGSVYRITKRQMPCEVAGVHTHEFGISYERGVAICRQGYRGGHSCRRRDGHEGNCEPIWKEIRCEEIQLPWSAS